MRDADMLSTRADLEKTVELVRRLSASPSNWKALTQFDGDLVNSTGGIIGRLNCQFKDWTCKEAQAEVIALAPGATVSDRTYTGDFDPRFRILHDSLSSTFGWTLFVKQSALLAGADYSTLAPLKEAIAQIQGGRYSFKEEQVPVGPVAHMTIEVLVNASGSFLAKVAVPVEGVAGIPMDSLKAALVRYAPHARIELPGQ